jgi:hypothetical protein
MRQLPKNHHLFSQEMGVDLKNPPAVFGMSNGVRELWIHSAADLGADWQMRRFSKKDSFELGAALYFYASGMGSLRTKLQPLAIKKEGTHARSVEVARVDYSGNSDPEPGAWARFAKSASANSNTDVKTSVVKFAELDAKKTPLAHLTGTAKVTFTDDEVAGLKKYLDAGGMLFVDAAGGSREFVESAQDLLKRVYPSNNLEAVAPDHPIYTGALPDGAKFAEAEFRKYGNLLLKRRVTKPSLEEITVDGRTRVIFSQYDICTGFLGTNTWGILGYAPATSEALGRNIVLYSFNPVPAPNKAADAGQ